VSCSEQVYEQERKLIMTKVYDAATIREKLVSNDKWLVRGILAIYARQTTDEQQAEQTSHHNGVGFNGTDANILSSFAKQILSWQATENPRYPSPLSPKQLDLARRKMPKYAGQLARIAEENNADQQDYAPTVISQAEAEMRAEAEAEDRAERAAIMAVGRNDGELTW
jgi:hypothetical protein